MRQILWKTLPRRASWPLLAGVGVLALMGAVTVDRTRAGEPTGWSGMKRDVSRLERDLDDILLDSPNFLVSGHEDAHGIYLDEVGLLLTFDASLVGANRDGHGFSWNGINLHGGHVIIRDLSDDEEDDDDRDRDREKDRDAKGDRSDRESRRDRDRTREGRRYERGKAELLDFVIDSDAYVDKLTNGQWFMVVACMKDSGHLDREDISRLVVKVRVDDLKAHRAGSLTDEALRAKIVIDEY